MERILIACLVLVLLKVVLVRSQNTNCRYFKYSNDGGELYGLIELPNVASLDTVLTSANFTVATVLSSSYSGEISPTRNDLLTHQKTGQPVVLKVTFPTTSPVPRLTLLTVNGNVLCSSSGDTGSYVTKIMLSYTMSVTRQGSSPGNKIISSSSNVQHHHETSNHKETTFLNSEDFPNIGTDAFESDFFSDVVRRPTLTRPSIQQSIFPESHFHRFTNRPFTFDEPTNPFLRRPEIRLPAQPSVTRQPVTLPPATRRPVTLPPATRRPVTLPPATRRPVTLPPATRRPVTLPPVTRPPVTLPPVTRPPATRPPVTLPPATRPPATLPPATQPPRPIIPSTTNPPQSDPGDINSIQCGRFAVPNKAALVYRGDTYERGEWPWLVAMYKRTGASLHYTCAGTLLTDLHALTAAHCVHQKTTFTPLKELIVWIGAYDLEELGDEIVQTKKLANTYVHEGFDPETLENDILIMKFVKKVKFTDYIRPICLWTGDIHQENIIGKDSVVTGWGKSEFNPSGRGLPRAVHLPIVSTSVCRGSNPDFHNLTHNTTICGGDRNGAGPCLGDSGGGLFMYDKNRWRIRGVVSLSLRPENGENTCNLNEYFVFTDAAQYLPWIYNIINTS